MNELTLNQIREKGNAALVKTLGPIGYVRYIQQFDAGSGDYTKQRTVTVSQLTLDQIKQWLDRPESSGDDQSHAA